MKILSSAAMKEADRQTIEEIGMPGALLMETAGMRVVELLLSEQPSVKKVVVLAGPGNNGGDGLVIARLLQNAGITVSLWSTVKAGKYKGDAGINEHYLDQVGFPVHRILDYAGLENFREAINRTDLIVDALLGIGTDRDVEGLLAGIIESVNSSETPVLSVDIPSGLNADSGAVMGCAICADWTVTFAFPKLGLLNYQGADQAGEIHVAQINIPSFLVEDEPVDLLTAEQVANLLPARPYLSHKGSLGSLTIIAGSPGMSGAAALAGESALKSGAGLVYLAAPQGLCAVIDAKLAEVITIALPESEPGVISSSAVGPILEKLNSCQALAVGPGLKPGSETAALLEILIKNIQVPLILDAGALDGLKGRLELFKEAKFPPVLTPHPGEMARLINASVSDIQKNRLSIVLKYARIWNCILLLKGHNTIIATPEGRAFINPTGGPSLATAGSGDLLTGMIASLIAQGVSAENAAGAGAFIHGLAGDMVPEGRGHMAGDVMAYYKEAFSYLGKIKEHKSKNNFIFKVKPY